MPSLTQIRYYVEVAECLNFSKAAQHLYITQPTLSRQMTALEEELNMQLFIRSRRGLKLTPAGVVLHKEFVELTKRYKESVKKAENANSGYSDTLYVGLVSGMFIDEIISKIISYFKSKYPNIQIFLMRCGFGELMSKLRNDELDLIITFDYHLENEDQLQQEPLVPFFPAWFVPLSNPLSEAGALTFRDMANQELLVMQHEDWQDGKESIVGYCQRYGNFYPNFAYVKDMDNLLLWLENYDKCAFLNSRIKVSDRVKMFRIEELKQENHYLKYAWKQSNAKYGLNILRDILSKIED